MVKKDFSLEEIPSGYYLSWLVITQAAFNVHVTLRDSAKVYFSDSQASTAIEPPLARGADFVTGLGLKITVEEPQSSSLKSSINTYEVTDENGTMKGVGYNISIEDQNDSDYNDVSISLLAWKSKG